ncbi:MAG TPA: suppressor of fused domain protein [Candidatus Paceibacterota bacterium]|nr:suppressor of fused domain protein [Candidatus Paceibacterota bacterium]
MEQIKSKHDEDPIVRYLEHTLGKPPEQFLTAIPTALSGDSLPPFLYLKEDEPKPHWLIVTSGFNQHGFELSLRLARHSSDELPPQWPQRMFEEFYAYVSSRNEVFSDHDYTTYDLDAGGPRFAGAIFVQDKTLSKTKIGTHNVEFLQVFPVTASELTKAEGEDFEAFFKHVSEATEGSYIFDPDRKEIS